MPDYTTQEDWYAATFGDYKFQLNGTTSDALEVIPASDGEIGIRTMLLSDYHGDVAQSTVCYLRPEEARALAQELLRLAELV